jgi:hypothetical protein
MQKYSIILFPKISQKSSKSFIWTELANFLSDQLSLSVFEETPKMSTYMFAFAIGDFVSASAESKSGVKVSLNKKILVKTIAS